MTHFETNAKDRTYNFWKRRALSIELTTDKFYQQKPEYIYRNPMKASICKLTEETKYSSALFCHTRIDHASIISGRISYTSQGLNYSSVAGGTKNTCHGVKLGSHLVLPGAKPAR